jgi:hypothetical protein
MTEGKSFLLQAPWINALMWLSFSSYDQNRSQCVPQYSTYKKNLVGALSKIISFLLRHITQQKTEAAASNCLFKLPPNVLDQVPNKWLVLRGGRIPKVMCTSPHTNLAK